MPAKIRLQRQGRKFQAIYSIVVADSRAPRDGKFIESLGQYNPNTNPATIILDFNKALEWLQKGAQPTDTCRAILSYKGVLYKKHLLEGVKKGAFDEAEAEKRFQSWMTEKEQKIQSKKDRIKAGQAELEKNRLEAESKIKEARALEIEKKKSEIVEEASAEEAVEEASAEAVEAPAAEEEEASAEEAVEEVSTETEESPAAEEEEAVEEVSAEAEETPAAEEEEAVEEVSAEAEETTAAEEEEAVEEVSAEVEETEEAPAEEEETKKKK